MRKTPLLAKVMEIFESSNGPLSVPSIQILLDEMGLSPNKTSLYRMMDKLVEEKIVQRVHINNDISYYEMCEEDHYHYSCDSCDNLICIDSEEVVSAISDFCLQLDSHGFQMDLDRLPLISTCSECS